ncbi:glutathione S-transferase N-terminal domain-containing protein [Thalassotalea sp. LPB0316]|uniref:glutaredoxin family protein n=1 Tax=Thalassotalea sp. LPB0316 TaxID=2769490 RepID=UPI001867C190|nr:glutathione S-transferase N-terminal domain-containing protein [Thalassotalea sp. LPB0316]QOL25564.1 glutathione S-transferase N-terminal domain-containing protein [Thalassotalea sp. LPB0316]
MKIIRWLIGRIILFFDFIFSPSRPKRSAQEQAELDNKTRHLSLYQLPACPFCVKVRRAIKRQGLTISLKNIHDSDNLETLVSQGGKRTVPCLRIEQADGSATWMYESNDIIHYLDQQFGKN